MNRVLDCTAFAALGTRCWIRVTTSPLELACARRASAAARAEIAACERALSRFDPESDLSAVNGHRGEWVQVEPRLLEALRTALALREATDGRCDPAVLPALVAAGYDRSYEKLTHREPRRPRRAGSRVVVDRGRARVRLSEDTAVDLGATAKGWIAQRALSVMHDAWPALPGAIVDLGGDLAIAGSPPGGGAWIVDVEDPRGAGGRACRLQLGAGGVATSGPGRRRFGPGRAAHHLIDPATKLPVDGGPVSATAVHPDPAAADAHATALAVTPVAEAPRYVRARPGLGAVLVPVEGDPVVLGEVSLA
jgi:FAD:protein FMN transferase